MGKDLIIISIYTQEIVLFNFKKNIIIKKITDCDLDSICKKIIIFVNIIGLAKLDKNTIAVAGDSDKVRIINIFGK